jgi:hypothetical protein
MSLTVHLTLIRPRSLILHCATRGLKRLMHFTVHLPPPGSNLWISYVPIMSYAKPCSIQTTMFRLENCDMYHSLGLLNDIYLLLCRKKPPSIWVCEADPVVSLFILIVVYIINYQLVLFIDLDTSTRC